MYRFNTRTTVRQLTLTDIAQISDIELKKVSLLDFIEREKAFLRQRPNQLLRSQALTSAQGILNDLNTQRDPNSRAHRSLNFTTNAMEID